MIYLAYILLLGVCQANLNFDPGLTVKNAAYWNPNDAYYFESCPQAGGRCYGVVPRGSGFYTLAYDIGPNRKTCCKPNLGQTITDSECANAVGRLCPYNFFWGSNFARVVIDKLSWPSDEKAYLGLQETLSSASVYGGMPDANKVKPAWSIRFLEIDFRTKVCLPSNIAYAHGTFSYYLIFVDSVAGRMVQFRLNLLAFWKTPDGSGPEPWYTDKTWNEAWLPGNDPNLPVWFLNGQRWGFSPNWTPWMDPTGDSCSSPIENAPWRTWRVDLHSIYNGMIADGWEARNFFDNAELQGSIVGGIEAWGQSYTALDIRDYRLLSG